MRFLFPKCSASIPPHSQRSPNTARRISKSETLVWSSPLMSPEQGAVTQPKSLRKIKMSATVIWSSPLRSPSQTQLVNSHEPLSLVAVCIVIARTLIGAARAGAELARTVIVGGSANRNCTPCIGAARNPRQHLRTAHQRSEWFRRSAPMEGCPGVHNGDDPISGSLHGFIENRCCCVSPCSTGVPTTQATIPHWDNPTLGCIRRIAGRCHRVL